jgi:exopolysaccharide biosynthesis predicted pyruvyltransferase EpsI
MKKNVKKKYTKIWAHGAHYGQNFGDILITSILVKWIEKKFDTTVELPLSLSRFSNYLDKKSLAVLKLKVPDKIFFGPGGYFGEPEYNTRRWNIRFVFYHGALILFSRLFNIKTVVYGVGVGPVSNPLVYFLIKLLFKRSELVCVRDEQSLNYTIQHFSSNAKMYPDIALNLLSIYEIGQKSIKNPIHEKNIGIHLPVGDSIEFPIQLADDLSQFIGANPNWKFVIIYDGPKQRLNQALEVILALGNVEEERFVSVESLLTTISNLDIILTTKLHVGICAYALKVKSLSIYTHSKNIRFYEQIDNSYACIGLHEYETSSLIKLIGSVDCDFEYFSKHSDLVATASEGLSEIH